ncbi:MAG: hypothetical protein Q8K82_04910 [Gemmatimonadaceae bacterium]|nr:hypothetical protein [Gemmatimonadaceae bacterium]
MADATIDVWGIVRRNWWIVLLAAIAGAVAAASPALFAAPSYTGKTSLDVNVVAIQAYLQMPRQDTLIAMSLEPAFAEGVAERLGVPVDQVAGRFRVYSTGNPQNKLWASYVSPDKDVAQKGADAVAKQVLATFREAEDTLLTQWRNTVKLDEQALADLGQPTDREGLLSQWSVRRALLVDRETLRFIENALVYKAATTVAASSRRASALSGAAGGALAGFFHGVIIVAVRELIARRRLQSATG